MRIFRVKTDLANLVFVQNFPLSDGNFITGPICNGKVSTSWGLDCRVGDGENFVRYPTTEDMAEVVSAAESAPFVRTPEFGAKKYGGNEWGDTKTFGNIEYISCGWDGFPKDIIEHPQTDRYGKSFVFFPYCK